jgi:prepilin-type N-terminal cleavage/methylation domain-containing protein
MKKCVFSKGFTLIELLIVVAIIAILAAIAIPNFLAAQTRAKVSRAKAEMRSLATALESYEVDNNRYPHTFTPRPGFTIGWTSFDLLPPYLLRIIRLTTPISYISTIPIDIFNPGSDAWSTGRQGSYAYFTSNPEDVNFLYSGGIFPSPSWVSENPSAAWRLASYGPTLNRYSVTEGQMGVTEDFYDPTNGTVSNGFIIRMGP